METFNIHYNNTDIRVEQSAKGRFIVHLPGKTMCLNLKQDNEGANHWFEDNKDNETQETRTIGETIEMHMAGKEPY